MSRARDLGSSINSPVAGKNFIINGGMDFFQRVAISTTSGGYGLDRWFQISSGSGAAVTTTQQSAGAPLGSRYYGRITTASGSGYGNQYQWIETSNVALLWGKTVTVSIKLRRSSAFAGTLSVVLSKSATVDAGISATWISLASATATNAQLPTGTGSDNWHTVSFSALIPNDGTANGLQLSIQQSQVETSAYWEMAQAQLEIGSVPTHFSRAGGTIQGELVACQRYYEKNYIDSVSPGSNLNPASNGMIEQQALILSSPAGSTPGSTRSRSFPQSFKVQKRVSPSVRIWDLAGNINKYTSGDNNGSFSANNNSLDIYGGTQVTQNSITWQTSLSSSSHVYAGIMWEVSAEL